MSAAIEAESSRIGATLVSGFPSDKREVQFSKSFGKDTKEGRLWTEGVDPTNYELLRRAVKKGSSYDHESGLWVKCESQKVFNSYRADKQRALSELVARNRKYAIEVLGGRVVKDED